MKSVREIIDSLGSEGFCNYCTYSSGCSGGVHGSPNGPTYPPCFDGLGDGDFDLEAYLEDSEEEDET